MVFDYTWNGITFEMEYIAQEDADDTSWTDVDFTDYSGYGDIVIDKKVVGNICIGGDLTLDAQTKIRKSAYEFFLNKARDDYEERGDWEYHFNKEDS